MNRAMSVYLDAVRFLAALIVFAAHASYPRFDGGWLSFITPYGHEAVIVFFVLSGYVIGYVAHERERDLRTFFVSRLARLYSVVLWALILTLLLDRAGAAIDPALYRPDWLRPELIPERFFANLLFVNELWFSSIRAFSNGVFWSLGYEFWYYVIFAVWYYVASFRRWLLLAAVLVLVGPKILLLAPLWWLGYLVYRFNATTQLPHVLGWLLFVGSILGFALHELFGLEPILHAASKSLLSFEIGGHDLYRDFGWSKWFLADYVLGVLIATNFIGFAAISRNARAIPQVVVAPIRFLAASTFTLYLLHFPLLQFFASVFDTSAAIIVATLASVFAVAHLTEHRKAAYRRFFDARLPRPAHVAG